MNNIESMLAEHPFLEGVERDDLVLLAQRAEPAAFEEDEIVFRVHEEADRFYLIVEGTVVLKIHVPQQGPIPIETIGAGQALGWSWFLPPYTWHFDARAVTPVRAVALDAAHVRGVFEDHPRLGYLMLKRMIRVMAERLQATRLQLMDVYEVRK